MNIGIFKKLLNEHNKKTLNDNLEQLLAEIMHESGAEAVITEKGKDYTISRKYLCSALKQVKAAYSVQRMHYYLKRLIKSITTVRTNRVNDINLNRWQEYKNIYTDSLWIFPKRDSSGLHNAGYWGNFIPQIPNQLLQRYTRENDWVIDPFAGMGTTLIEGKKLKRNVIGIELQQKLVDKVNHMISRNYKDEAGYCRMYQGNSCTFAVDQLLKEHNLTCVQHLILHPPYHDIINFSADKHCLSNLSEAAFFKAFTDIVLRFKNVLQPGRFLSLVIGDKYKAGEWIPLGFKAMQTVLEQGFSL
ncbi:MAG TPA: DNA methyltransferase, partial [Spirochaetota bacterium]|nr:DNA methyltransferase [Spirochaetota bacterium]